MPFIILSKTISLNNYLIIASKMNLTEKKCVSCEGGVPPLEEDNSNDLLQQIPSWEIKDGKVHKQFKFKDFKEAIKFVNKIAKVAEQEGHHPDILINYNKVTIDLYTHAINGLSENDFIVAAKIEKI
jgi:4a-hydroxytetrahydrobiopterin dehydratase